MFTFIKQIFFSTLIFFASLSNVNPLECILMKDQECKVRPEIVNNSRNDPIFYPFSITTNKCSGNCNDINIHMQKFVFQIYLKIQMLKHSIYCQELMKLQI